jgi:Rad3-related DNA helicase
VNPAAIYDQFPAPSYRGNQKQALDDIKSAFNSDANVVLVQAPTGSGKSLLARAIAGCARAEREAQGDMPYDAYYTTPQVSQLDDVEDDDLLEDLNIVRGKNNYDCILPGHTETPVSQAKCVRDSGFDCELKHRCPYFTDRATAKEGRIAAMTLAYFMQTAASNIFDQRDVVVIDEAHGLRQWAEMYGNIELKPRTVPFWDDIQIPKIETLDDAIDFAQHLYSLTERRLDELKSYAGLTPEQSAERKTIYTLRADISWLVYDYHESPGDEDQEWVVDQDGSTGHTTIKPLNPERYLTHTVWDRGQNFALLSATILNKDAFCLKVGLNPDNVVMVKIPHTFPVENRPLYDVTQGEMTHEDRDDTLPKISRTIVRVMARHQNEKGLIHCHSYDIQKRLYTRLAELGVSNRLRKHTTANRDEKLTAWKNSDGNDVFLSVKMEEALDLKGDLCRWQVICKAPYENIQDSRVESRLDDGQWGWYYRTTLETVIQACGRVIRSPDDHGATYLADSSLLDVFREGRSDMPPWFKEQVDRISKPTLPEIHGQARNS